MTIIQQPLIGIEFIQRHSLLVLHEGLNDAIDAVNEYMAESDAELAERFNKNVEPTTVEYVEDNNFYEGHHPSLLESTPDGYPNCAVWSVRSQPSPESAQMDHTSAMRTLVYVELMVKSQDADETEVNRRIARTVEAAHACILGDPTLGGLVSGVDSEPTVTISEVFKKSKQAHFGSGLLWQGARIEYTIKKESAPASINPSFNPDNSGNIFRNGSQYGIDQI